MKIKIEIKHKIIFLIEGWNWKEKSIQQKAQENKKNEGEIEKK